MDGCTQSRKASPIATWFFLLLAQPVVCHPSRGHRLRRPGRRGLLGLAGHAPRIPGPLRPTPPQQVGRPCTLTCLRSDERIFESRPNLKLAPRSPGIGGGWGGAICGSSSRTATKHNSSSHGRDCGAVQRWVQVGHRRVPAHTAKKGVLLRFRAERELQHQASNSDRGASKEGALTSLSHHVRAAPNEWLECAFGRRDA